MMKLKLLFFLLCINLSVNFFAFSAGADEEAKIIQAYFTGDTINVFTTGISTSSEITAKMGNNDYYRILSFDTGYRINCELTSDRYDLLKRFRSFDFDGDSSMVYNAIFETIDIKFSFLDKNISDNLLSQIKNNNFSTGSESKNNLTLYVIIVIACIVFAGGISVALIITLRQKIKKKENNSSQSDKYKEFFDVLLFPEDPEGFDTISFYLESDMTIIGSATVDEGCEIIFGRSKDCDVVFKKETVSRKQFSIRMKNKKLYIKNISSSNITELNGKTLSQESVITDGDKIQCGRETMVVQIYLSQKTRYHHV